MNGFAVHPDSGQVIAGGWRVNYAVQWDLNQAPVPTTDAYTVAANRVNFVPQSVLANDTWVTGIIPTVAVAPLHGTLQLWSTGAFTYTPTAGYTGSDSFQYRVGRPRCYYHNTLVTLTVH